MGRGKKNIDPITGQRIKLLREQMHIDQQVLAKRIKCAKSSMSRIENGQQDITPNTLKQIAQILQTSPSYLMGWTDDPNITDKEYAQSTPITIAADTVSTSDTPITAKPQKSDFKLSENEKNLVLAYRAHPEMQAAVNKMLDITLDKGNVIADDIVKELRQAMPSIKSNLQSR